MSNQRVKKTVTWEATFQEDLELKLMDQKIINGRNEVTHVWVKVQQMVEQAKLQNKSNMIFDEALITESDLQVMREQGTEEIG